MIIGSDLFSSTLEFQKLNYDLIKSKFLNYDLIKKKFKNNSKIKIVKIDPKLNQEKLYSKIEIYWGNRINSKIIRKMSNLKWIHYGSTGMNDEVLEYAKDKKIIITNTKRIFDKAVASTVLGFIFVLSRGLNYSINNNKAKRDVYNKIYLKLNEVFEKKILFVGYGGIAKNIAKVCRSMNMKIYKIKRRKSKSTLNFKNLNKHVKDKDFIINLLPSTKLTKNIFNLKIFKNMNKKSYFINVGRGSTVSEKDLEIAIKKKYIAGAALDVIQKEPVKYNFSLLKYNNVVVTPHIAGIYSNYSNDQCNLFSDNLKKYLNNKKRLKGLVKGKY